MAPEVSPTPLIPRFTKMAIFERGGAALRDLLTEPKEIYICPLCMRGFARQAVERRVLTWEHVPPESIGGKRIILTCSECNSKGGTALDAAVYRRAQHDQFLEALVAHATDFEGLLKFDISGEALNTRVIIRGTDVTVGVLGKHNDPATVQRVQELFRKRDRHGPLKEIEFKLSTIYGFKQRRAQLGDLRTAYLAAFAMFGYRYIVHPDLAPVRDQIRNPEQEILPKGFQTYLGSNTERERAIWIVRDPIPMLFVRIDRCAVVLPSLEVPGEPWSTLTETVADGSTVTLRGARFDWPTGPRFMLDLPPEEAS